MTTLMQAHYQWASRPADQRFLSLTEMSATLADLTRRSASKVVPLRSLSVKPVSGDSKALAIVGPSGVPVAASHYAFGQFTGQLDAERNFANVMRELPAPIAADAINYQLMSAPHKDVGVLLTSNAGRSADLRAVTGPAYGRIYNSEVVAALIARFGDGVSGQFRVPGEFGKGITVNRDNTTLYASDRDMFVFLADETNRIELPGRRPGEPFSLARGFFIWNSEVGKSKLGIATFLFDYVCGNRMVWGAEGFEEFSIRHTASAPARFLDEIAPALEQYANSSTHSITRAITDARAANVPDVDAFLSARFSKTQAEAIKLAHFVDENRPIESIWDVTAGVTAYARSIPNTDSRIELEREAGRILKLAA